MDIRKFNFQGITHFFKILFLVAVQSTLLSTPFWLSSVKCSEKIVSNKLRYLLWLGKSKKESQTN